jgi:hypothetical protein
MDLCTLVDTVKLGLLDYLDIIKRPMDLNTVRRKLLATEYETPEEFASDMRQICINCYTYNPPDHDVVKLAKRLEEVSTDEWK